MLGLSNNIFFSCTFTTLSVKKFIDPYLYAQEKEPAYTKSKGLELGNPFYVLLHFTKLKACNFVSFVVTKLTKLLTNSSLNRWKAEPLAELRNNKYLRLLAFCKQARLSYIKARVIDSGQQKYRSSRALEQILDKNNQRIFSIVQSFLNSLQFKCNQKNEMISMEARRRFSVFKFHYVKTYITLLQRIPDEYELLEAVISCSSGSQLIPVPAEVPTQ